jgi:hypothetical protein
MHGHIPAEEIPIGMGCIVLRQGSIPRMGDGCMSEHLEAIPEEAQDRIREMRSDTEAADVTPNLELEVLIQVHGETTPNHGINPKLPSGGIHIDSGDKVPAMLRLRSLGAPNNGKSPP